MSSVDCDKDSVFEAWEFESSLEVIGTAVAADSSMELTLAGGIQYGSQTPALEQMEVANDLASNTSSPRQFSAIHFPILSWNIGMIQRHPVSQYGHGVTPVFWNIHG